MTNSKTVNKDSVAAA